MQQDGFEIPVLPKSAFVFQDSYEESHDLTNVVSLQPLYREPFNIVLPKDRGHISYDLIPSGAPFYHIQHIHNPKAPIAKFMFHGDSFSIALIDFLQHSFRDTYYLYSPLASWDKELILEQQPEIILDLLVERNVLELLDDWE
jgi:hypothetical protein